MQQVLYHWKEIKFWIAQGRWVGANDFLSQSEENEKLTSSEQKAKAKFQKKVDADENEDVRIYNECILYERYIHQFQPEATHKIP